MRNADRSCTQETDHHRVLQEKEAQELSRKSRSTVSDAGWPQLHYRRRELHLHKQPCTPQRLSTIRTDFCPHTNWQICPPLLKASSTHPVITTCAHNTKQTSEATTTSTNNTPTTSKQNAKAKQPLLATCGFCVSSSLKMMEFHLQG